MRVSVIVAIGNNSEIGLNNQLLWRLPADLKKFKELTMGHHILMGRKTYESIGRPLPGRDTVIISRNSELNIDGCTIFNSIENAILSCKQKGESELFICGGEEIYKESLKFASRIYLSRVDFSGEADAFFPQIDESSWKVLEESKNEPNQDKGYPGWVYQILDK